MTLVLGNISIFWEYRDISLDNIIFHIVDILGYRNIVFQHLSYLSSLRMLKMKYIVWICIPIRLNIRQSPLVNRIVRYSHVTAYSYHTI